ncbi:MAG: nucleic acid-binding protein [Candidatus Lokiarchaeota archaeon]|nr:nucleic acid-binding protein [Candidatus Lokiarchaeota archaeon]MBD3200866.1 nucleic acid-binding protein [Candidatus Lokiarchaeota archaeon]
MTFTEKQTDPTAPTHWRGNMQADYLYPNGVAGDKFFKHLKNNDNFLATVCPDCEKIFFPPRLYCEDCFVEIPGENWIEVPATGTVRLFTTATINAHGKKMETSKTIGLIDIDKTDGAMLGIIKSSEMDKDLLGLKVKAILRPREQREGTIKDILYFEEI